MVYTEGSYLENSPYNSPLLADLSQINMAYCLWKQGMQDYEAAYHLYYRKAPFKGVFTIFSGLDQILEILNNFSFSQDDISFLRSLKNPNETLLFEDDFLAYLSELKADISVHAVAEGTIIFPNIPIVRVTGNMIVAQLLEASLLNAVNFNSLVASKAARMCQSAKSSPVWEYGLRRAQGADAAVRAARGAWIGGCAGTTNVFAAQKFNIPLLSTMSHSWVLAHDSESESFKNYLQVSPQQQVLVMDTFDNEQGVKNLVEVLQQMNATEDDLPYAIRLDSGDLIENSKIVRKILDDNGYKTIKIAVSGDLDEHSIEDCKSRGARIDIYCIGTKLVTAFDEPALNVIYKLSAVRKSTDDEWQYKLKKTNDFTKITNPGIQQVRRYSINNMLQCDVVYEEGTEPGDMAVNLKTGLTDYPDGEGVDLLEPVFENGQQLCEIPDLHEARKKCADGLLQLSRSMKAILFPEPYRVSLDDSLNRIKNDLLRPKN